MGDIHENVLKYMTVWPNIRKRIHSAVQRSPKLDEAILGLRRQVAPEKFKEGFIQAGLNRVKEGDRFYLEIGVYKGDSFRWVESPRKVGVDPDPLIDHSQLAASDILVVETSDDFFASEGTNNLLSSGVSVALIDGLHEFKQAWRDVANTSRFMQPNGLIVLDDCNPSDKLASSDERQTAIWNGDVWKVMALVRATQPQWRALTVDADQGVGLIWGFDRPLTPVSRDQINQFKSLTYDDLERDRAGRIGLTPARFLPADLGFGWRTRVDVAIKSSLDLGAVSSDAKP